MRLINLIKGKKEPEKEKTGILGRMANYARNVLGGNSQKAVQPAQVKVQENSLDYLVNTLASKSETLRFCSDYAERKYQQNQNFYPHRPELNDELYHGGGYWKELDSDTSRAVIANLYLALSDPTRKMDNLSLQQVKSLIRGKEGCRFSRDGKSLDFSVEANKCIELALTKRMEAVNASDANSSQKLEMQKTLGNYINILDDRSSPAMSDMQEKLFLEMADYYVKNGSGYERIKQMLGESFSGFKAYVKENRFRLGEKLMNTLKNAEDLGGKLKERYYRLKEELFGDVRVTDGDRMRYKFA